MLATLLLTVSVIRRIPGPEQLSVLERFGATEVVAPGWALVPPGLARLTSYPLDPVEIPLPAASAAGLRAADGSRFGLKGWVRVVVLPERWRSLHHAAAGEGVSGVVTSAVRVAATTIPTEGRRQTASAPIVRRFEERLDAELTARGLELRELRLAGIDYLVAGGEAAELDPQARLLVIGLDGADWKILDPLIAQGRLPNLAGLVERGARGKLRSISPMLSPVVWTTMATGVEPTRHGILDFVVQDGSGARQPVTSAQRKVPTVWEMLSRRGVEVGVIGWWASWPADPVRGYLVADRVAYQLFDYRSDPDDARGKTWPPDLYEEIRPILVEPASVRWETVSAYLSGSRLREEDFDPDERETLASFRTLIASGQSYLRIGLELRKRQDVQLEVHYFEGTDTVGHLFMPYRPPRMPGVSEAAFLSFASVVDRYYETMDGFIGQLLCGREGWTVLLVSDHGFASDATRPHGTDSRIGHGGAADWHRRFGIVLVAGPHVRKGGRIEEATVYDVAPTILALFGEPVPQSWPGTVLAGALTEEFLDEFPVRFSKSDPARFARNDSPLDPATTDLIEKLKDLGYVGAADGGGDAQTAHNNKGVSLLAQGRFAEAEQEFRAALSADRPMPMLLVNLGVTLRLTGRPAEAEEPLRRALTYRGTRRMAGDQLALLLLSRGELAEAEGLAREILAEEPDSSGLRNTLGLVLEARGDLRAAESEYLRSAELDSDSALAPNNLGNLSKLRGDLDGAEGWYLRAVESDPYFMGSYNNLALVYQARGQIERAIDLYDRALSKAPGNAVVRNNLGSLYFATRRFDEARTAWEAAAETDPSYASPWNNLAGLEITLGNLAEAERRISRALELNPTYGDARINLAAIRTAQGDRQSARDELERATLDPLAAATAWKKLGLIAFAEGDVDRAAAAFGSALDVAPSDREALNALGEVSWRQGNVTRTIELWRRSLELSPNQPDLRKRLDDLEARRN